MDAARAQGSIAGAGAGLPTIDEWPPSLLPPSESVMRTVLMIIGVCGWASTMTAKSRVRVTLGGMSATACVQIVPAGLPSGHDQPGALAAALNVVEPGTVSVMTTPVAGLPPVLP